MRDGIVALNLLHTFDGEFTVGDVTWLVGNRSNPVDRSLATVVFVIDFDVLVFVKVEEANRFVTQALFGNAQIASVDAWWASIL